MKLKLYGIFDREVGRLEVWKTDADGQHGQHTQTQTRRTAGSLTMAIYARQPLQKFRCRAEQIVTSKTSNSGLLFVVQRVTDEAGTRVDGGAL